MKIEVNRVKDKILNGDMSRREFSKTLAALGLTTVMMPMLKPSVAQAAGDVNMFTWSGYDDEAFYQNYMKKYGGMPDFSFFGSEDEALAKIRSGFRPTMGHPCSDTVTRWGRAGILQGIDTSRLSNYSQLSPELTQLPGNYLNGETIFIPFDWGNSSVAYRTDLVDNKYNEENSWEIMFDPEYSGRLAMYNSAGANSVVAGLTLGFDSASLWGPSDDQIAAIRNKLKKQQPLIRYYWDDQTTAEQGLASGELVAAYSWNEAPKRLKEQGLPVGYMNPKEGILFWVCGLALLNNEYGSGNIDTAHEIINEMISEDVGKYVISEWGYGHSNKNAFNNTPQDVLDSVGLGNATEMMASGVFFQDIPDDINTKLQAMFSEIQAGM